MSDLFYTDKDGTRVPVTDADISAYLARGNDYDPAGNPSQAEVLNEHFETHFIQSPDAMAQDILGSHLEPEPVGPVEAVARPRNSFYVENAFKRSLEQNTIFDDVTSDNELARLRSNRDFALYQYVKEQEGADPKAFAQAIEAKALHLQEAMGRTLTQEELGGLAEIEISNEIKETLQPFGGGLPLNILADPRFAQLVDRDTYALLTAQYQAEHPQDRGFWSDLWLAWDKSKATNEYKSAISYRALSQLGAEKLEQAGLSTLAEWIKPSEEMPDFNELQTKLNILDLYYNTQDSFGTTVGQVAESVTAPYRDLSNLALLGGATFLGGGYGFTVANGLINAEQTFSTTVFDIAYEAAKLNPALRDNFADTIVEAVPYAATVATLDGVESSFILGKAGKALSPLVDGLKRSAKKMPITNSGAGKVASELEANTKKFRDSALAAFGKDYLSAFTAQAVTTGMQGAITQYGINQLAGVEGQDPGVAAAKAVRDNLGIMAALSLIPGAAGALGVHLQNRKTASDLNSQSERIEGEAIATAAPINDTSPQTTELVFSMTDGSKYRFSAADIVKAYQDQGLTPDEFRSRYEMSPGDFDGLEELARTGGDIEMTKAHWMAYYAEQLKKGDKAVYDFFNPFLRADTTQLSLEELREKLSPENFAKVNQELLNTIGREAERNKLADFIRSDITTKIGAQDLPNPLSVDYLSALTSQLFRGVSERTGVDAYELYKAYGPQFQNKDKALNLSGKELAQERITEEGGAYDRQNGVYYLGPNSNIVTVVHEFGHAYLGTLERITRDPNFKGDKSVVENELSQIRRALGDSGDGPISEQLHEKFTAALVATITGNRWDNKEQTRAKDKAANAGKADPSSAGDVTFIPDTARFNKTFFRLKAMMARTLANTYQSKKQELDAENESRRAAYQREVADYDAERAAGNTSVERPRVDNVDINQELALEEYRTRFSDADYVPSQEIKDFINAHVLGDIAFEQHAQLAGLHPVFDPELLRNFDDPELARLAQDISDEIVDKNEELRASYVTMQELAVNVLRRGSRAIDQFKHALLTSYYKEKNLPQDIQEEVNRRLDKVRRDFIKKFKEENGAKAASDDPQIVAAAEKQAQGAYERELKRYREQRDKAIDAQSRANITNAKKVFEAYRLVAHERAKLEQELQDASQQDAGALVDAANDRVTEGLSKLWEGAGQSEIAASEWTSQGAVFEVSFTQDGKVTLEQSPLPHTEVIEQFAQKNADGGLRTRKAYGQVRYDYPVPDLGAIRAHFSEQAQALKAQEFEPSTAQLEAAAAVRDARQKALLSQGSFRASPDGPTVAELSRRDLEERAAAAFEARREEFTAQVTADVENTSLMGMQQDAENAAAAAAKGYTPSPRGVPAELKPVFEYLEKLEALGKRKDSDAKLRAQEERKLARNPAWALLKYFNAIPAQEKLNLEDVKRTLGAQAADHLEKSGVASSEGTLRVNEFAAQGPVKSLLDGMDGALRAQVQATWESFTRNEGFSKLGIRSPERMNDAARGRALALAMSRFGSKSAKEIVDERVMNRILTESKDVAIDSLKYNPNIVNIAKRAFSSIARKEQALLNRLLSLHKEAQGVHGRQTDLKLLSDSIINRSTISSFNVTALQNAAGRARDKAMALANKSIEDSKNLNQISQLLTIDAVNKMACRDGAERIEQIARDIDKITTLLKKGSADTSKTYDENYMLALRYAASRLGLISKAKGRQARDLLANNAPGEVKDFVERVETSGLFSGDYKLKTIPELEAALQIFKEAKDYARALKKLQEEKTLDAQVSDMDKLAQVFKERLKPEQYLVKTKDGGTSYSIGRLAFAKRWIGTTFRAYLAKVEQWCEVVDGSENGTVKQLIYNPIRNAYNESVRDRAAMTARYQTLVNKLEKICTRRIIDAPELVTKDGSHITFGLGKDFGNRGSWELIGYLMHIGNDGNLQRLLDGKGIDPADFKRWFVAAQKRGDITKDMMDAVQELWDIGATQMPLVQKAYYAAYGRYMNEIKPREIVTDFGTYKGGYAPAIRDRNQAKSAFDTEGNVDALVTGDMIREFVGEASWMKERAVSAAEPLNLDIAYALQTTLNVVHYSHMLEPVKKLYTFFESPQTGAKALFTKYQPQFYERNIKPWLSRTLRDSSSSSPATGEAFAFLSRMTNRIGLSYMFANVSNAVQGLTNLVVLAGRVPPGTILKTIAHYTTHFASMRSEMLEQSQAMRNRFEAGKQRSIADMLAIAKLRSDSEGPAALTKSALGYEHTKQFISRHGYFLQSFLQEGIDTIAWHAARDDAISRGMNNAEAIDFADSTIRLTQGSMDSIDLNNVETGGPILKMFTQFTGYFNTLLNLVWVQLKRRFKTDSRAARAARAAYVLSTVVIVPAILSDWIAAAFKGENVFTESEDWQDFMLNHALIPSGKMFTAMVPIYGSPIVSAWSMGTGQQSMGGLIGTPATIGAAESILKMAGRIAKDQTDKITWQDGLTVLGVMSGVPVGTAVGRRLDYAQATGVDTFGEALKLLVSGQMSKEEKEKLR